MAITDWSMEDRPRERFMANGPAALSKAELLAILVGSGSRKMSAVEMMRLILSEHGDSIHRIERLTVEQLCAEYRDRGIGLGPAKAVTILAACAIARRYAQEEADNSSPMDSSERIAAYFSPILANLPHEECHVMLLSNTLHLLSSQRIAMGGLTATTVDVRILCKQALLHNATAIALCHNHPSGSLTPSRQDDNLTRQVREAAQTLGIRLIDHIIVSTRGYYSYNDQGKL